MIGRRALSVFLVVLGLAASSQAKPLPPDAVPGALDRVVEEALARPGAVGLQIAVGLGDGVIVEKSAGLAEAEHDVPVKPTTLFRIGSVTKQFTAAAIMNLVEAGKIDLDAPFQKYGVDFPTGKHVVTVRHLLTHTSGIKSYTSLGPGWKRTVALEMTHDQLLAMVRDKPFDFSPGERFLYNNTGYYLLGVILEKVSGQPFGKHVSEALFTPLGLGRTRLGSNADLIPDRAQGYRMVDGKLANDALIGMSQPGAAGALLSTAGELIRWQRALAGGKVVSPASYRAMTTPYVLKDGKKTKYGFGLGIGEALGHPTVRHGGGIHGFNSVLSHYPEDGLTIAVLSNSEALPSGLIERKLLRALLGLEDDVEDLPVPPAEIPRVTGTYHLEGTTMDLRVWGDGGLLRAQPTGQSAVRLLRQKSGEYRADLDSRLRIEFDEGSPCPALTLRHGGTTVRGLRKKD